jgi:hypothetical protein
MADQLLEHVGIGIDGSERHRPNTKHEVALFEREATRALKELLTARVLTVRARITVRHSKATGCARMQQRLRGDHALVGCRVRSKGERGASGLRKARRRWSCTKRCVRYCPCRLRHHCSFGWCSARTFPFCVVSASARPWCRLVITTSTSSRIGALGTRRTHRRMTPAVFAHRSDNTGQLRCILDSRSL